MSNRLGFRQYLLSYIEIKHLYFQPPPSITLEYPCVVYRLTRSTVFSADNRPYKVSPHYSVTLIDKDPDSIYVEQLNQMPGARLEQTYSSDNLNHWVYSVHYTGTHTTN